MFKRKRAIAKEKRYTGQRLFRTLQFNHEDNNDLMKLSTFLQISKMEIKSYFSSHTYLL